MFHLDPAFGFQDYWGIDQYLFESCCSLKYHLNKEDAAKEYAESKRLEVRAQEEDKNEDDAFGSSCVEKFRRFLWNITEYPESSMAGKVFAIFTMALIFASIAVFIIGLGLDYDGKDLSQLSEFDLKIRAALETMEGVTVTFFISEYVTR